MLTTGLGVAVGLLIGVVEDCAGGGGPVGTLAAFGTICGLPCSRCTSAGSAATSFFVTGSF